MNNEFKRRDWIIFNQLSQSPVLNTCDVCYFLMASNQVLKEQGLLFGGKLLQGEELFRLVKKVFYNSNNLPALARAYAGHHQIVCAVLECEGGNEYLSKRKGMSFRIRRSYMKTTNGEGVMMVSEPVLDGE